MGLTATAVQLADGQYKVSVAAKDATTGAAVTVTPMAIGLASGLIFKDGITYLDIQGHEVALSDIYSVYQAAA